jgi:general nucleoside transport system permease protein
VSGATIASIIAITLALTPSVLYATFGEIVGQRAGIVNLGIEGVMLIGAAVGFAVGVESGNSFVGLLAGAAAGAGFNLVFAAMVIGWRANQLASGFALFFLGGGISMLIGAKYIGSNVGGLGQLAFPELSSLPSPWDQIFKQDILVWLMLPVALTLWWVLFRTRWGLRLRAVGEDKDFSFASGVRTSRIQYEALVVAGGFYGTAGADLILAYTKTWQDGITQGRGFIAIAIVILALWDPVRAIVGALLFSAAFATGIQLQTEGSSVSPFVLDMLPYVVTIAVVLIWGRAKAFTVPAGLREVFAGTAKAE